MCRPQFVCLSVDGHLGSFYFFTVENNAAISMGVQISQDPICHGSFSGGVWLPFLFLSPLLAPFLPLITFVLRPRLHCSEHPFQTVSLWLLHGL